MAYDPIRCEEICGDGFLYELPCDDGNLVSGDGCSANCTVEKDYVCMNGTTTTPSVCSYNGTFDVALDTGDKAPGSNSLVLTYDVYPAAPLIVINKGSTDFTSLVSFPDNPGVSIT
jgi:cysteine-rich repeat protein